MFRMKAWSSIRERKWRKSFPADLDIIGPVDASTPSLSESSGIYRGFK